jgi:hypothetical protein
MDGGTSGSHHPDTEGAALMWPVASASDLRRRCIIRRAREPSWIPSVFIHPGQYPEGLPSTGGPVTWSITCSTATCS